MRVLVVVVLCLLACLLAVACTSRTAAEEETAGLPAMRAGAVEEIPTQVGPPPPAPADMTATAYPDGSGFLTGPHFSVRLAWRATGPAVTEQAVGPLASIDPTRAADGEEVLVVAVDPSPRGGQWELGDDAKPTAELVAADRVTALELLPLADSETIAPIPQGGALVVASVPTGAPVTLRVTDAGRTQSLDVRTGRLGEDAIAAYYRPNTQELSQSTELTAAVTSSPYGTDPTPLTMAFEPAAGSPGHPIAMLAPYRPAAGWARPNRAWLTVPRPAVATGPRLDAPFYTLAIDDPTVFALRLPDGTMVPALPGSSTMYVSVEDLTPNLGRADVVFDVPADFRVGVVVTSLGAAPVTASYGDAKRAGHWAPAPPAVETPIALR